MSANKKQNKTETTTLIVAGISKQGPKSTSVSFVTVDGVRPWAWLPNELVTAHNIRAGVTLNVTEVVAMGDTQSTYTSDGIEYELKTPKQQLMLGGQMSITQPEFVAVSKLTVV